MLFVGTHHKTGTKLFRSVFEAVSTELGLRFHSGFQRPTDPDTELWFTGASRLDGVSGPDLCGIHIIRHPINLLHSAFRYHRICREPWCINPRFATRADGIRYDFGGLSYQEKLNSLPSVMDGLLFELRGRSFNAIMDMYAWDYSDSRFATFKLEDVSTRFDETFSAIFAHLGLPPQPCNEVARRFDVARFSEDRVASIVHITDKARVIEHDPPIPAELAAAFKELFPNDLLARLGYEPTLRIAPCALASTAP